MCLAVPGIVTGIDRDEENAVIDYSGVKKTGSIMLVPQVKIGDYVLVHAGFIIQILDKNYGAELSQLTEELNRD